MAIWIETEELKKEADGKAVLLPSGLKVEPIRNFKPLIQPQRTLPEILANPEIEVATLTEEERQVIVHIHFLAFPGALIRIWSSTFLIPSDSDSGKVPLVHAENITYGPQWTQLLSYGVFSFSLIFSGLPKGCRKFDLVEEIEESGAFFFPDIERNETDVYHLWI
jgi:hypothetical protein